jgi:chromosome segregation ATPase
MQYGEEIIALEAEKETRDQTIAEHKRAEQSMENIREELDRRIETLETYISELPTTQEFAERQDELNVQLETVEELKGQIEAAEGEVVALTATLADRDEAARRVGLELKYAQQQVFDNGMSHDRTREELLRSNQLLVDESHRKNAMMEEVERELEDTKQQCNTWKQRLEDERAAQVEADERFQRRENQLLQLRTQVAEYQSNLRDRDYKITELDDLTESMEKKMAAQAATIQDLRTVRCPFPDRNFTLEDGIGFPRLLA